MKLPVDTNCRCWVGGLVTPGRRGRTHLELVLQDVLLVRHLAIHAEQTLFLGAQRLEKVTNQHSIQERVRRFTTHADIDFILLVGIHGGRMLSSSSEGVKREK